MGRQIVVISLFLLSVVPRRAVFSFPTGAGGCVGGMAAVGGSHLRVGDETTTHPQQPSPLNYLTVFSVNGQEQAIPKDGRQQPLVLTAGVDHEWSLRQDPPAFECNDCPSYYIKGFLVRFEAENGEPVAQRALLAAKEWKAQVATASEAPILGITHTNDDIKESVSGTIRLDSAADSVYLDITVVYQNSEGYIAPPSAARGWVSRYGHVRYSLNFVDDEDESTLQPTKSPTQQEKDEQIQAIVTDIKVKYVGVGLLSSFEAFQEVARLE